jgi:general secretion pathway protein G
VKQLVVLVAIFALAASGCDVSCARHGGRAGRETATKDNLYTIRKALDRYYEDNRHYPTELRDLVPKYLRRIPPDPLTGREWVPIRDGREIIDVKTAAPGATRDGVRYDEL